MTHTGLGNGKRYADATTPVPARHWYVVAFSHEIDRTLRHRWVLDQDLLMFRASDGQPVVLQNRCAHRSYPLDQGFLDGDTVVCGYHGLAYDRGGRCVRVPSNQNNPADISLQRYPVVERTPYIWVWFGAEDAADADRIPDHHWLAAPDWESESGYTHVGANYVSLHENLMDLTHFSYLQAGMIGTRQYAEAPFDVELDGATVRIARLLKNDVLPEFYAGPMNLHGVKVERASDSLFLTPAFQVAHSTVTAPGPGADPTEFRTTLVHAITPETRDSTHYFWAVARDYALGDRLVSRMIGERIRKALDADAAALESIAHLVRRERRPDFEEANVPSDRAGLAMRRIIQELADREQLA